MPQKGSGHFRKLLTIPLLHRDQAPPGVHLRSGPQPLASSYRVAPRGHRPLFLILTALSKVSCPGQVLSEPLSALLTPRLMGINWFTNPAIHLAHAPLSPGRFSGLLPIAWLLRFLVNCVALCSVLTFVRAQCECHGPHTYHVLVTNGSKATAGLQAGLPPIW